MASAKKNMEIFLTDTQSRRLQERAKARGISVSAEVRCAIDRHLSSLRHGDLALFDAATRQIERNVREMIERLARVNAKLDAVFAQRHRPVDSPSRAGFRSTNS